MADQKNRGEVHFWNSWPQVLLLGDSLTQRSFNEEAGWASMLASKLQRTADVINRGFSGYNSRWCRVVMDQLALCKNPSELAAVVICLGANDSWTAIPNCLYDQHVPLIEFEGNMEAIVNHFIVAGVDGERVILCTPPPYEASAWSRFKKGVEHQTKTNEQVAGYAEAVRRVALKKRVTLVDIHNAFLSYQPLEELFIDGLHFDRPGAQLFYQKVEPIVSRLVESSRKTKCLNMPLYRDLPELFIQAKLMDPSGMSKTENSD